MDPSLVVEVPANRFPNALLEFVGGGPAEFPLNLGSVDGVAAVVARAVLDEGDELARVVAQLGRHLVDQIADDLDDPEVGPLVVAADVIGLADAAAV